MQPHVNGRLLRAAPALGALVYPGLIWCGPAIWPALLGLALVVPAAGLVVFHRTSSAYPRTRGVALLAVGAPALYSWLGGLLDFQRVLPLHAVGVWYPLWALCSVVAFTEAPRPIRRSDRADRLAFAHGISATVITLFAVAHIANHVTGLGGGERHIAVMAGLRLVYRAPAVEAVLLASVAFQMFSGLRLLRDTLDRNTDWIGTWQACAGAYLACFFASHLTAALRARLLRGVDTNWVWLTADSMLTDPWSARLAPYYFLGVIALGVHAAAGLRYVILARGNSRHMADRLFLGTAAGATVISSVIMWGLLRS
jgi:hypothetical protein